MRSAEADQHSIANNEPKLLVVEDDRSCVGIPHLREALALDRGGGGRCVRIDTHEAKSFRDRGNQRKKIAPRGLTSIDRVGTESEST